MGQIGLPKREIIVIPQEEPVFAPDPRPAQVPAEPERVPVPV